MQMPLAQSYLFTSDAQCTKAVVLLGVEAYPALQLAPRDLRGWHVELTSLQYLYTSDIHHKLGANVRGGGSTGRTCTWAQSCRCSGCQCRKIDDWSNRPRPSILPQ